MKKILWRSTCLYYSAYLENVWEAPFSFETFLSSPVADCYSFCPSCKIYNIAPILIFFAKRERYSFLMIILTAASLMPRNGLVFEKCTKTTTNQDKKVSIIFPVFSKTHFHMLMSKFCRYRVTHKGWDFIDKFILCVYLNGKISFALMIDRTK